MMSLTLKVITGVFFVLLLSIFSGQFVVQGASPDTSITSLQALDNNAQVKLFNIRFLSYDQNTNTYKMHANISLDRQGTVKYKEEYYYIDNRNNPAFTNSKTYYEGSLEDEENGYYNVSFDAFRPVSHGDKDYSLIKAIIFFNDNRIWEMWLTKNKNFNDNTNSVDTQVTPVQTSDQHEIEENTISSDSETVFKYTTLDITEVGVTGTSTADMTLRVDIYNNVPSGSYKPDNVYVYRYFEISPDDDKIKDMRIAFQVDNSWLTTNNITNIGIIRWDSDNKVWIGIPTRYIDRNNQYTYFEARSNTSGPSTLFAIMGYGTQPNQNTAQGADPPSTPDATPITTPVITPTKVMTTIDGNNGINDSSNINNNADSLAKSNRLLKSIIATLIAILLIDFIYVYKIKK